MECWPLSATRAALSGNFLIALILCYLVLVAIFSHWGFPLVIMTVVPLGIAGGIVGLWLLNTLGAMLPAIGLAPISQSPKSAKKEIVPQRAVRIASRNPMRERDDTVVSTLMRPSLSRVTKPLLAQSVILDTL